MMQLKMPAQQNNSKHFGQRYTFCSSQFLWDPRPGCWRGFWHRNFGRPCRVLQRDEPVWQQSGAQIGEHQPTLGGGLHADPGLSHIYENDGTLFADQVVQPMRLHFFRAVTCVPTKATSLHLCNYMEAEVFVDGCLNSCPSNPFMIPAWCVKIAKKTQRPQERGQAHDVLDTSLFEADPESSADDRRRAHRGAFARDGCEAQRSRATFCSDCVVSKSSCMCEWRRSL